MNIISLKKPVVVFGNIMTVLVRPEGRVLLMMEYESVFRPRYFVIYDLEQLDDSPIRGRYRLVREMRLSIPESEFPDLPPVKLRRKVSIFECLP